MIPCSPASVSAWKPSRERWPKNAKPRRQHTLPLWLQEQLEEAGDKPDSGITPLESNALALRFALLKPGPDLAMRRPENEAAQTELLDPPSVIERRLRARVGEMVAAQAVEDELALQAPRGAGLYHRYNAVLKRVMNNRSRAEMTISELEASLGWLERHRLADHVDLLEGDPKYAWSARQRRGWIPPVGRTDGKPRSAQGARTAFSLKRSKNES